jgi:hypothetical protein
MCDRDCDDHDIITCDDESLSAPSATSPFDSEASGRSGGGGGSGICPVHKAPCKRLVSKAGRPFFKCLRPGCRFFRWANTSSRGGGGAATARGHTRKRPTGGGDDDSPAKEKKATERATAAAPAGADVTLQLCSRDRVSAHVARGTAKKDRAEKAISGTSGARYDEAEREWSVPLDRQDELLRRLGECGVTASGVPAEVITVMKAAKAAAVEEVTDFTSIPSDLFSCMFPFQVRGFTFGVQHGGRCMICDEMGLGKTI